MQRMNWLHHLRVPKIYGEYFTGTVIPILLYTKSIADSLPDDHIEADHSSDKGTQHLSDQFDNPCNFKGVQIGAK